MTTKDDKKKVSAKVEDQKYSKPVQIASKQEMSDRVTKGMIEGIDARVALLQTQINNLNQQKKALQEKLSSSAPTKQVN